MRFFNILSQYILVSVLIRRLGSDVYGIYVWAYAIVQYLIIFVNFGFNTFAAKFIPENSGQPSVLNKIFSSILYFKVSAFFSSAVLFVFLIFNYSAFSENADILLILIGLGLGEALFPIWLFQGFERLEIPTKIIFVFRILLVVTTLLLIKDSEHLIRYAYILTTVHVLMGLSALIISMRTFNIKLVKVKLTFALEPIKEAFVFFAGTLFGRSYNFLAIFLLGIYCSMEQVSAFDISFKIMAVMQMPFEALATALFPTIVRTKNLILNQKVILIGFMFSLLLWAFTYWQANFLMELLGGSELASYGALLQKLSVLIPVVVITYLLGANTLVAFGLQNHYNISFIIPSILYILLLSYWWLHEGLTFERIVMARILVDVFLALYRLIIASKYRLIFISK